MLKHILLSATALVLAGVNAQAQTFEDARDFFGRHENTSILSLADFDDAKVSLGKQFDAICGDTFCEGEFSNLTSLGLACSVDGPHDKVGQCIWTFAGSAADIDPITGKLNVRKKVFECDLGFQGTVTDLAAFLRDAAKTGASGFDGLHDTKVPGRNLELMRVLLGCM